MKLSAVSWNLALNLRLFRSEIEIEENDREIELIWMASIIASELAGGRALRMILEQDCHCLYCFSDLCTTSAQLLKC